MAITDKLSEIYAVAEDKFYKLFDWLELKGIPIYGYNDLLETKGIPVFPFTIALLAIIALLFVWIIAINTGLEPTLVFSIKDTAGNSITTVNLSVWSNGTKIQEDTKSNLGELKLKPMQIGTVLEIKATKQGYEDSATTVIIKEARIPVSIELTKIFVPITGLLRLVDEKTGSPIKGALVTASWESETRQVKSDENGLVQLLGVPQGEKIRLQISADNYEDIDELLSFEEMQTKTLNLPAKTTAMFGSANFLLTVFDASTGATLNDVSIKIFNAQNDQELFNIIASDGTYSAQLPKGTSVRVVATKAGYIKFDSTANAEPLTIRNDEETMEILLELGGQKIKAVIKQKDSISPPPGVTVSLYNAAGALLDSNKTGFSGTMEFSGLNADANYFVSAYLEGYIGETKKVNPGTTSEIELTLEIANEQNSAPLNLYVTAANGETANDASLNFFEITEDWELFPLGMPALKTEYDGFATTKTRIGSNVFVTATKGIEYGDANKTIVAMTENAVAIRMQLSSTAKTIMIYTDENQLLGEGHATIETATGEILFDANFFNGQIIFDSKGNKTATITITTPDGNVFSEQINIPDSNALIELHLGKQNNNALAPEIKFLGIIDSEGKTVISLTPGAEYWLKFETSWTKGFYNGGIHVRLGSDETKFADSEDVSIVGVNAPGAETFYGRTWNASPAPGNEGIDLRNAGKPGAMNKWIELYYTNPQGVKIIKVKVRVQETAKNASTMLHYRTWSVIGTNYERNPLDKELEKQKYTDSKTGLYADTMETELSLFAAQPECEKDICISYNFVTQSGAAIPVTEFKAIKDKVFALEATIKSKKTVGALLKANTQKDKPKIYFTGVEVETFTEFIDNNATQSSIEVNDLSLVQNAERRVRFYFKPRFVGNTSIKTQLIAEDTVINNEFFFNIFEERLMTATIIPDTVNVGADFTVFLKDVDGKGIENATLQLKNDAGSIVASTIGDGTGNNGAAGAYFFKNTYSAGTYSLELTAQTFTPLTIELPIGSTDLLKLSEEEFTINIPKGERTATIFAQLQNASSLEMQNIEYSIEQGSNFPMELEITASVPTALKKGANSRIEFSAIYSGDNNSTMHGEADITIKGSVAGKYPATAKAHIIIEYNRKLDAACLEFDKKNLDIMLSGEEGDQKEEILQVKNNCSIPLALEARVDAKSSIKDDQLIIQVEGFSIEPNQSTTISVTAINKILRKYSTKEKRNFEIVFNAPQIEKRVPLTVTLWDKAFSILTRDSIVLWLSQSVKGEPVVSSTPLFIKNTGESDIEDLSIEIAEANWEGVSVRIAPAGTAKGQTLKKNANLLPTRMVVAEKKGGTDKGKIVQGFLTITGMINGKRRELRKINVWINVSALNCLKAFSVTDLEFESASTGFGVIDKKISVRNTCEEAVRIVDVDPNRVGANELGIVPLAAETLEKDSEAEFILRLTKGYDYKSDNLGIAVVGLTMLTQKFISSDRLNASVSLGEKSVETGLASAPYKVNICEPDGTISKEKKEVRFPLIAKTPDCAKAYCDAELAAEYIAKKINEKISSVKSAVDRANEEMINFPGCAGNPACSFNRMGVKTDNFDLYLSNDNVTDSLFRKILLEKTSELKGYNVSYCSGTQCDVEAIAATGWPNLLYLTDSLRGCGKFKLSINGAVFAAGSKIQNNGYTIAVNVSSKQTTPECTNKITNTMNFLPQDSSLSAGGDNGAWPGMVESVSELEEAGKLTAKELFTKEERYTPSATGNKLVLTTGELKSGIVKIEMQQTGTSSEPKTITAIINKALGTGTETIQKEIAKEAANAIASLKTQRLEEGKSCVSMDDSFMVIGSYTKFGALSITGASELKMKQGKTDLTDQQALKAHSCVDLNVVSKIAEEVYLKTNAADIENKPYGISKVYLRVKQKNTDKYIVLPEGSIAKLEQDEQSKEYKYYFQSCAIGSKQMSLAKKGIELTVTAENRFDSLRRVDPPKKIRAVPCATHPYDLLNAIDKAAPGDYYTTVGWKGEPDKIKLSDLVNKMNQDKLFEQAKTTLGQNMKQGDAFTELDKSNRLDSIWGSGKAKGAGYVEACVGATLAYDAAIGPWGLGAFIFDATFNCILPATWASASLWGGTAESIKTFIEEKTLGIFSGIASLFSSSKDKQEIITGAEESILAKEVIKGWRTRNAVQLTDISKFKLNEKGLSNLADDFASQIKEAMLKKVGTGTAVPDAVWKTTGDKLKETLLKDMKEMAKTGQKFTEENLEKLTTNAIAKTFPKGKLPAGIMDEIMKNRANYATDFKTVMDDGAQKAWATEIAESVSPGGVSERGVKLTLERGSAHQVGTDAMSLKESIVNRLKISYAEKLNIAPSQIPLAVEKDIIKSVESSAPYLKPFAQSDLAQAKEILITTKQLEQLDKEIMVSLRANSASLPAGTIPVGSSVDDVIKVGVEKKLTKEALDEVKNLKLPAPGWKSKLGRFGLSMAKGVIGGLIANLAGLAMFNSTMESIAKDLGPSREFNPPIGAIGAGTDKDPWIMNGETYKVKVLETKNAKGESARSYEIELVDDLSTIPEKANWISLDCEGTWADKELGAIVGDYSPSKEKISPVFGASIATTLTVGYYGYAGKIKTAAETNKISQEQLLAILTADAMARFSNLAPNECGKWLEAQTKETGETAIDCIANKTRQSATIVSYFNSLDAKSQQLAVQNAERAQSLWQTMKTKAS